MSSYILSNAKVYIKDSIASTLWVAWTFRISVDLERSLNIETAAKQAFFVLKNGTQIERFLITATWGVATIVKRWLEQDWITANSGIQKPWWEWAIGYITMKPSDLIGSGQIDDPFTFNWDVTFNNPVIFTESIKIPVYANAAARDVAIPTPANGMSVYLTAEWYFSDYQAWAWSSRAAWASTVNATTTVSGKVELPTTLEMQALYSAWWTWAAVVVTPDRLWSFYSKWDWSDGNVTISINTTLTRDMFYADLTVNTWVILDPAGYAIYVSGTLTLSWTAKIARNGNNWTNAVLNWGWAWWAALASGTCWPCEGWVTWSSGGTSNGVNWVNGTWAASSGYSAVTAASGWNGWSTWAGWSTWGTWATSVQWIRYNRLYDLAQALSAIMSPSRGIFSTAPYGWTPWAWSGWAWAWGGGGMYGWGGWGSWGNGWNIFIYANILAGTWTIEAKWGTWGNGSVYSIAFSGWGGWGWGGSGWVVTLVYNSWTPFTITVTGWAGWIGSPWLGWGTTAWTNGGTGTSGTSIVINK